MIGAKTQVLVRPSCVAEMREVALPLFEEHHAELAALRPDQPLDINWTAFEAAERRRDLVCRVAWISRQLVGYSVASFSRGLFSPEVLLVVHALFVSQVARGAGAAQVLIEVMHDLADGAGAQLVWHVKAGTAAATVLERRCGPAQELCFFER